MPILGIDNEQCNLCKNCLDECPNCFRFDGDQKIEFNAKLCNLCGRCICRCQQDAILHEKMGEVLTFDGVQDPNTIISYDALNNIMMAKRSMRRYKKKKVSREDMEKILTSMKYAPTGGNLRTLRCTIISDEQRIKELSDSIMDALIASNNPIYSERIKLAKERGFDSIFYQAPHVLIIHSNNPGDAMNSTIALTYAMLSAQSLGLASCWIGLAHGVFKAHKDIKEKLTGIKDDIWGVIIVGYPARKFYRTPPRPMIKTTGLEELE